MHMRTVVVIFAGALAFAALAPALADPASLAAHHQPAAPSPAEPDRHHHRWVEARDWRYPAPVSPLSDPQAPLDFDSPPAPAGEEYGYFCPSAGAYYPYIESCPGGWRLVPKAIGAVPPGG